MSDENQSSPSSELDKLSPELRELVRGGNSKKIAAIKQYREETGEGLAEAKQEVERLIALNQGKDPSTHAASQASGCLSCLAVGLFCVAAVYKLFT